MRKLCRHIKVHPIDEENVEAPSMIKVVSSTSGCKDGSAAVKTRSRETFPRRIWKRMFSMCRRNWVVPVNDVPNEAASQKVEEEQAHDVEEEQTCDVEQLQIQDVEEELIDDEEEKASATPSASGKANEAEWVLENISDEEFF